MERLPVEVIGNILSQIGSARDVVIASTACKKWRDACKNHLRTLSFNSKDWPLYNDFPTSKLEIFITQTIFQTNNLRSFSVIMEDIPEFSAAAMIAWIMHTRETLRHLCYYAKMVPEVNILDKCSCKNLEVLALAHITITSVEPTYQKFVSLKVLSLSYVGISALDMNMLLTACPKIEVLSLITPDIFISDSHSTLELSSPSLKEIYVEGVSLEKFLLETDCLEDLHLKDCSLEIFEFVGSKGSLKKFKIDDVIVVHLDIGENLENLEMVDVSNFTIVWSKFYEVISSSSRLKRLRIWGVVFEDDDFMELNSICTAFNQLTDVSFSYELTAASLYYCLLGTAKLENVVVLELAWMLNCFLFSEWVEGLLERCPHLKKLVIYGNVSEAKTQEDCQYLAEFTKSMVCLMRRYLHVDVHFEYH